MVAGATGFPPQEIRPARYEIETTAPFPDTNQKPIN
jgi:hypothetical protein